MYEQISQRVWYLRAYSQLSFAEESKTSLPNESSAAEEQEEEVEHVESDTESIGEYCFLLRRYWHTLKIPVLSSFYFFTVIYIKSISDQCHQITGTEFLCSLSVGLLFYLALHSALSHDWSLTPLVVFPGREKNQNQGWKSYKIGNGSMIGDIKLKSTFNKYLWLLGSQVGSILHCSPVKIYTRSHISSVPFWGQWCLLVVCCMCFH